MPDERYQTQPYRLWPISRRILVGLTVIGAITAGIIICFVYVGGFLSPDRLTQTRMIDAFEEVNGVHPGFRRNHAKGVCIAGHFDSNGNGVRVSKAVIFKPGRVPVIGKIRTRPRQAVHPGHCDRRAQHGAELPPAERRGMANRHE